MFRHGIDDFCERRTAGQRATIQERISWIRKRVDEAHRRLDTMSKRGGRMEQREAEYQLWVAQCILNDYETQTAGPNVLAT